MRRPAKIPACVNGMEPCAGAQHVARHLRYYGHDVRLVPAQYAKLFLKGHNNDYCDGEAIAEAVQHPAIDVLAIKTSEQCDLVSLHRVRSRPVHHRTGIISQIRGLLDDMTR